MKDEVQFSLGFFKPSPPKPFGLPGAFGSPGAGGSNGFADPERGIAYAYVHNRMGGVLQDARDIALREALDSVINQRSRYTPVDGTGTSEGGGGGI